GTNSTGGNRKPVQILPLLISTWNYTEAHRQAWKVLRQGPQRTRQAVIRGCLACQNPRCGHLLGAGSCPDARGHLSLEAAIMDGGSMRFGAVAGMEGIRNAILVANAVLKHTKHTLLVGRQAAKFARSMGYKLQIAPNVTTKSVMQKWKQNKCQPNFYRDVLPFEPRCGPYRKMPQDMLNRPMHPEYSITPGQHDQLALLALDANGSIHVASHSSGALFRVPGRVGDSAVPGAGIYADKEVGGAVACGDADILMRHLPAFLAVESLRAGHSPEYAAETVIQRVLKHNTEFNGAVIVVNRLGKYAASCGGMDEFKFVVSGGNKSLGTAHVETIECVERYEFVGVYGE
ncbi:hypothetical protein KR009_001970, partial [Drosophila setifemur]